MRKLILLFILVWLSGCDNFVENDLEQNPEYIEASGIVLISAAESIYKMGSLTGNTTEQPVHEVTFTYDFWMDSTEISQGNYEKLMSDPFFGYSNFEIPYWNDSYGLGQNYPAYYVNWFEAVLFCNSRSKSENLDTVYKYSSIKGIPGRYCTLIDLSIDLTKKGYRLPTEAEWEYACRAGTTTEFSWGDSDDKDTVAKHAWYSSNTQKSQPVGLKTSNLFGLYDMHGNLFEWCNDWYSDKSYESSEKSNPIGPLESNSDSERPLRGGSYLYFPTVLRSSGRYQWEDSYGAEDIGFRCVINENIPSNWK